MYRITNLALILTMAYLGHSSAQVMSDTDDCVHYVLGFIAIIDHNFNLVIDYGDAAKERLDVLKKTNPGLADMNETDWKNLIEDLINAADTRHFVQIDGDGETMQNLKDRLVTVDELVKFFRAPRLANDNLRERIIEFIVKVANDTSDGYIDLTEFIDATVKDGALRYRVELVVLKYNSHGPEQDGHGILIVKFKKWLRTGASIAQGLKATFEIPCGY